MDVFGIKKTISEFPEICKPAFVSGGKLLPSDVLSKLKPVNQQVANLNGAELTVWRSTFIPIWKKQLNLVSMTLCVDYYNSFH